MTKKMVASPPAIKIFRLFLLLSLFLVPALIPRPGFTSHCTPLSLDTATLYANYLVLQDTWIPFAYTLDDSCDTDTDQDGRGDNYAVGLIPVADLDVVTETQTLTRQIAAGADDAYANDTGAVWTTGTAQIQFGGDAVPNDYNFYLRFTNITVPRDAVITDAHLILTPDVTSVTGLNGYPVNANDVDNAAVPANFAAWAALVNTTSRAQYMLNCGNPVECPNAPNDWILNTSWNGTNVLAGIRTMNRLTGIIQELVNRPGWVSGNAIAILSRENFYGANTLKRFYAFEGDPSRAAQLSITWRPVDSDQIATDRACFITEFTPAAQQCGGGPNDVVELVDFGGGGRRERAVLSFSLAGTTPVNTIRALLRVRNEDCSPWGAGNCWNGQLIDVHRLTQNFVEAEVTWNEYSLGNAWTSPGGDFAASVETYTALGNVPVGEGGLGSYVDIDITDLIDWDSNPTRVSLIMKFQAETAGAATAIIYQVGANAVPNFDLPKLLLEYAYQFNPTDVITKVKPLTFDNGNGGLYTSRTVPPATHYLILWDDSTSILQTHAFYKLINAEQVTVTGSSSSKGATAGVSSIRDFSSTQNDVARNIPILNLFMGEGNLNLASNIGLDATSAFILLTIFLSFAAMMAASRFISAPIVILFAGSLPVMFMSYQGLIPSIALIATLIFIIMVLVWNTLVTKTGI